MKVGDLVKVVLGAAPQWHGQLGIIVEIDTTLGVHPVLGTMLISGAKKWFDLDELELVE